jgi:glutamate dehydrogenase (NADP+)
MRGNVVPNPPESDLDAFLNAVRERDPEQPNFHQAVEEVARHVLPVERADARFRRARVLERLTLPDRVVSFRVTWMDDDGEVRHNRGWRVQMCDALGPYKGGLRFRPEVDVDTLKFLAFEQTFKNALTGLPLGGAKGGADLDPTTCSRTELQRFCQAFMLELVAHIGPDRDVPAGDINVGSTEIGWLYGAWKRYARSTGGALTGKPAAVRGIALRPEATGFGLIYIVQAALTRQGRSIEDKRVAISGKGNVATHAAQKALELGAKVVTLSDTAGTVFAADGLDAEQLAWVREQKANGRSLADPPAGLTFNEGALPWSREHDIALPCATQNEVDGDAARHWTDGPCTLVAEGANMPLTADAVAAVRESGIVHLPGKAANAGGVAVSGLEMSQNGHRRPRARDDVDRDLRSIMERIEARCAEETDPQRPDYLLGANRTGYRRVAEAIVALGAI